MLILIHHYNIMNMIITIASSATEPLNCILLTILTLSLTHHLIISIGHNLLNISDLIVFVYPLPLFPGKDKHTTSFIPRSLDSGSGSTTTSAAGLSPTKTRYKYGQNTTEGKARDQWTGVIINLQ